MQEVIDLIRRQYNKIAVPYTKASDVFNKVITHPQIIALAQKWGGDFRGKVVLDLGCGPGGLGIAIQNLGAEVYGIDLSEELIRIAIERGFPEDNAVHGSMHEVDIAFHPKMFDLIVSNYALHYLPPEGQELTLRGVYKTLKPGGLLVYSRNHPFFLRHGYLVKEKQEFPFRERGFPSKTNNYFSPILEDSWGKEEFGEELHMFRLDWPEIHAINERAGLHVLELFDGKLSDDTRSDEIKDLIELFKTHPFAAYVVARKE